MTEPGVGLTLATGADVDDTAAVGAKVREHLLDHQDHAEDIRVEVTTHAL
jgi:hypothetical protein